MPDSLPGAGVQRLVCRGGSFFGRQPAAQVHAQDRVSRRDGAQRGEHLLEAHRALVPVGAGEGGGEDVQVEGEVNRALREPLHGGEVRCVADPQIRLQQRQLPGQRHPAAAADQVRAERARLVVGMVVEKHQREGLCDALEPEQAHVVIVARADVVEGVQRQRADGTADPLRTFRRAVAVGPLKTRKIGLNSLHSGVKIGKNKKNP